MPPEAIAALEKAYARHGVLGIFVSRFLPGVRAAVTPFAGVVGMAPARALVPAAAASAIWYALLVAVGTVLGVRAGRRAQAPAGRREPRAGDRPGLAVALIVRLWWRSRRRRAPECAEARSASLPIRGHGLRGCARACCPRTSRRARRPSLPSRGPHLAQDAFAQVALRDRDGGGVLVRELLEARRGRSPRSPSASASWSARPTASASSSAKLRPSSATWVSAPRRDGGAQEQRDRPGQRHADLDFVQADLRSPPRCRTR